MTTKKHPILLGISKRDTIKANYSSLGRVTLISSTDRITMKTLALMLVLLFCLGGLHTQRTFGQQRANNPPRRPANTNNKPAQALASDWCILCGNCCNDGKRFSAKVAYG